MTTSDETDGLDHPTLRRLVEEADALPLVERRILLKGLIPGFARDMSPIEFEGFIHELRLKGARFYDATLNPGKGRAHRHVMGRTRPRGTLSPPFTGYRAPRRAWSARSDNAVPNPARHHFTRANAMPRARPMSTVKLGAMPLALGAKR
jgi:hypothetical protein